MELIKQQQEAQKAVSLPLKNGRHAITIAAQSALIKAAHDEEISLVLKFILLKLGIREKNLPTPQEKAVLLDHIRSNFPVNTVMEIRLAFELAISGDLDLRTEDVKCYENFSCAYFSLIMKSYQRWAEDQIAQKTDPPPPQRIYSDEEIDNFHRQWTEEFYQRLRNGIVEEAPEYAKGILKKDGLLKDGVSVAAFLNYKLGIGAENIYRNEKS